MCQKREKMLKEHALSIRNDIKMLKLLEFTWIYFNLLEFTWIYLNSRSEKKTAYGRTDKASYKVAFRNQNYVHLAFNFKLY